MWSRGRLDLFVDFAAGGSFAGPEYGQPGSKAYHASAHAFPRRFEGTERARMVLRRVCILPMGHLVVAMANSVPPKELNGYRNASERTKPDRHRIPEPRVRADHYTIRQR